MAVHTLLTVLVGSSGIFLAMAGVWLILRPRRLIMFWFEIERRLRNTHFGGGWTHMEQALAGRGYFWVPDDIELRGPEAVYEYVRTDRFWRSGYGWFLRVLCWYAGGLLFFFGFLLLGGDLV